MAEKLDDWRTDDRAQWVANSLRARIAEFRAAESRCRKAFTKPYMGEPSNYLADTYADVADLLESRLRSFHPSRAALQQEPRHDRD